jgi:four helix bundle protein
MSRRILIVSASMGAGHDGAANELRKRLEHQGHQVRIVDFLDCCPFGIGWFIKVTYLLQLKVAPWSYDLTYRLAERPSVRRDRRFRDQLMDAAASPLRNIEEGFERYEPREFRRFLRIARGSLGEVRGHFVDGVHRNHWTAVEIARVRSLVARAITAVTRLMNYLERADPPARG